MGPDRPQQGTEESTDDSPTSEEILADTNIVRLFSKPAAVKILTVMTDLGGQDVPVSTIADKASISRNAWYNNVDLLLELGLIEQSRSEAGAKFYRAKMDSDSVDAFVRLRDTLAAPSEN